MPNFIKLEEFILAQNNLFWLSPFILILAILIVLFYVRKYQIRKLVEEAEIKRLKDLDIQKTRFYTNITHQFLTPLTLITGLAKQLIQDGENYLQHSGKNSKGSNALTNNINERAAIILRNSANLLQLVHQVLHISGQEKPKLKLKPEPGDIIHFIRNQLDSFSVLAKNKQINLVFNTNFESLEIEFDRQKLQDVIFNLLSNAIKFTLTHGIIKVSIATIQTNENGNKEFLKIVVFNSGIGISEGNIEHIFDRYYSRNEIPDQNKQGNGIGLSYTKELVEEMGGSIAVESEDKVDTSFTVILPLNRVNYPLNGHIGKPITPVATGSKLMRFFLEKDNRRKLPLLLLIEDNYDVACYVAEICHEAYDVLWAADGIEGVDMAVEKIPDIIISDVMMPGKDGLEVAQFLKNDQRTNHIPLVFLTARIDIKSRITGLLHGANAYLNKPFEKEELLLTLKNILDQRKTWQNRYSYKNDEPQNETSPINLIERPDYTTKIQDAFLGKVNEIIDVNLSNEQFDVQLMCNQIQMS